MDIETLSHQDMTSKFHDDMAFYVDYIVNRQSQGNKIAIMQAIEAGGFLYVQAQISRHGQNSSEVQLVYPDGRRFILGGGVLEANAN